MRVPSTSRKPLVRAMLIAIGFVAASTGLFPGCSSLAGGDLTSLRDLSQRRFDRIQFISTALDILIARPAPSNLTPAERAAWDDQTNGLIRVKSRLVSFGVALKATLDQPVPSTSSFDLDKAVATSRLVDQYVRLGQDFTIMMAEIDAESKADEARIAALPPSPNNPVTPADSVRTDSLARRGGLAFSNPLKTRHDEATSTISTLT